MSQRKRQRHLQRSSAPAHRLHLEALEERTVPSFIDAPRFAAGTSPVGLVSADFNGDGAADLAVINENSGFDSTISVLLGNGDGSFRAPQTLSLPALHALAVGDFNGDGIPDLVATNGFSDGKVTVLLGNGDGTFQAGQSSAAGESPSALAVGDFNGDGQLDVAVLLPADYGMFHDNVAVLLGNGNGTFQAAQTYAVGSNASALQTADWNGDGHLDLVVANAASNSVSVLLGNGDGTFLPANSFAVGADPVSLAVGDFNGDGSADLAVLNQGTTYNGQGTVSILLGNGDGTFQPAQNDAVGAGVVSVAAGDFNGDGLVDLAVTNSESDTVSILQSNGDGTFQLVPVSPALYVNPGSLVVGDFNADGHADLAVANSGANTISVLLGTGAGTFRTGQSYAVGSASSAVAAGDFNNDGHADLAVANTGSNTVTILLGNGDGTFVAAQTYTVGLRPVSLTVSDFNGDGIPDLAVVDSGSDSVFILLGMGDGTFQTSQDFAVGFQPSFVAAGDLNGDGHVDLVVTNQGRFPDRGNTVSVLLGLGDGTFQAAQNYAVGYEPVAVALGDVNGDGIPDLVVANYGEPTPGAFPDPGTLSILLGNGDGTFQPALTLAAGFGPNAVVLGDFNGDGKLDLATTNFVMVSPSDSLPYALEQDVRVFLGNGDGTFQTAQTYAVGLGPVSLTAADVNQDGVLDLIIANSGLPGLQSDSTVSVLLGNGDGSFQATQSYGAGGYPASVVAGDFNGDGYADLAVANNVSVGTVTVLLNAADWGGGHADEPSLALAPSIVPEVSTQPLDASPPSAHSWQPLWSPNERPVPSAVPGQGKTVHAGSAASRSDQALRSRQVHDAVFESWSERLLRTPYWEPVA